MNGAELWKKLHWGDKTKSWAMKQLKAMKNFPKPGGIADH